MNLKAIAGELGYVLYDKWNYVMALPLSAMTTAQFYLGRPVYGIRDALLSLILMYSIGKHREFQQEIRQRELAPQQAIPLNDGSNQFNQLMGEMQRHSAQSDEWLEKFVRECRLLRESLKDLEHRI